MISDEVFIKELDEIYKKIGFNSKSRHVIVNDDLTRVSINERDHYLEQARKRIPKKERIPTEDTEQINFVEWFRKTYPDVVIMAIWNGGTRSQGERAKQIAMGLHPGAADLFVPAWGLWVEMKRTKGYVWSKEQQLFSIYIESLGNNYIIGIGYEDAKEKVLKFIDTMNKKHKNN